MTGLTTVTDALSGALRGDRRQAEEFADLLEGARARPGSDLAPLVGLARALAPAEHLPAPGFRTALRARLVAEAAARQPSSPAFPSVPAQHAPERVTPAAPRWRHAVVAVALASTLTGVGAAAASSQALPGDPLYGLKLRVEAIQLSLAHSDLQRGRELLDQAEARLGEAERLAAGSSTGAMSPTARGELTATLIRMDEAATAGAAEVLASYEDTGDPESLLLLARSLDRLQPRLQELSTGLDAGLRGRVQRTLDSLATLSTAADAVLPTMAARAGETSGRPGRARADVWEADRSARFSSRGALPPSAATTSSGHTAAGTADSSRSAGGLVAGATDDATSADSALPSVTSPPAVSTGATSLPVQPVPVPSVAATPVPTISTSVAPPTPVLPTAPSVTCVPVPPLTAC